MFRLLATSFRGCYFTCCVQRAFACWIATSLCLGERSFRLLKRRFRLLDCNIAFACWLQHQFRLLVTSFPLQFVISLFLIVKRLIFKFISFRKKKPQDFNNNFHFIQINKCYLNN